MDLAVGGLSSPGSSRIRSALPSRPPARHGPVVGLEVVRLQRHAMGAEAIVRRDQLLAKLGSLMRSRILARTNSEISSLTYRSKNISGNEASQKPSEPSFQSCSRIAAARSGGGPRRSHARSRSRSRRTCAVHSLLISWNLALYLRPIGVAVFGVLHRNGRIAACVGTPSGAPTSRREGLDDLDAGRAGADDTHPLAREVDRFVAASGPCGTAAP